jgi:hypothetical protein
MKFQFLYFLAFNIVLLAACGPAATSKPADSATEQGPPKPPTQWDIDRDAFLTARQAASLRTWSAANLMLERIDVAKIKDGDVLTYVDFSKRCAKLCDNLGIDRNSDPMSPVDVMTKANSLKALAKMVEVASDRGPGAAATLLAEAIQIQKELPVYLSLDEQLAKKYRAE